MKTNLCEFGSFSVAEPALVTSSQTNPMPAVGHSRRSDRAPMTSSLPQSADILASRHVSNVPMTDMA